MNIDSRLQSRPPAPAAWLGYGGLLPFIAMAAGSWLDAKHSAAWQQAQVGYGAVILSFVGALHWAFAMRGPTENGAALAQLYVWSVMPALAGWVAQLPMQWRPPHAAARPHQSLRVFP